MKPEFDKWFDNANDIGNNSGAADYGQCNIGWNAARDKIIEILKKNIKIQPGGLNCNMINENIIWEIERF